MTADPTPSFELLAEILRELGIPAAVIGAQAVNVHAPTRATLDIDLEIVVGPEDARRLYDVLAGSGFQITRRHDHPPPSGPDFLKFRHTDGTLFDILVAKTPFETELVARARPAKTLPLPAATPEDLLILKLIAHRLKDRQDILELLQLPDLDTAYLNRRAVEWEVDARLDAMRAEIDRP